MAETERYVPRKTDHRLGMPENPKPDGVNEEAPMDCWIECVDGYLRHSGPGDWIDHEGDVHYVQAGAPNVLTVEEARFLADFLSRPCGTESERPTIAALRQRFSDWANREDGEPA
jgi:hypothetical protein